MMDEQPRCVGMSDATFFPEVAQTTMYDAARNVCRACPVKRRCREDILKAEGTQCINYRAGMFGGWTPKQRVTIARRVFGTIEAEAVQADLFDMEDAS